MRRKYRLAPLFFLCALAIAAENAVMSIREVTLRVDLATSAESQRKGLQGRQALEADQGLLFVFQTEAFRSFWMKDMAFAIDIFFLDSHGFVVDMKQDFAPCAAKGPCIPYKSKKKAMYVLEVVAGFARAHGIAEGDRFTLPYGW